METVKIVKIVNFFNADTSYAQMWEQFKTQVQIHPRSAADPEICRFISFRVSDRIDRVCRVIQNQVFGY